MLDAQEYLHLAVNASQQGDHHASIDYLHKCLDQEPENSDALYLLAAEHAELGLLDRGIAGMERAIELDPAQETAKFQLALLYLAQSRPEKARDSLESLHEETQDAALKQYSFAMLRVIGDEIEKAVEEIRQGLDADYGNTQLDNTMRNVLAAIERQEFSARSTPSSAANTDNLNTENVNTGEEADEPVRRSVFLGAYKDKKLNDS